jgi:hypothetical protein
MLRRGLRQEYRERFEAVRQEISDTDRAG